MSSSKLTRLSDFFREYSKSKIKPATTTISNKKLKENFNGYGKLLASTDVWSLDTAKETQLDTQMAKNLVALAKQGLKFDRDAIEWDRLWPFVGFGWTGPHLRLTEMESFETIELIFRTLEISEIPETWNAIKERKPTDTMIMTGPPMRPDIFMVHYSTRTTLLLHEYLVGKIICNFLRSNMIPNYPYYFGLLHCSKPEFDPSDKSKLIRWCQNQPTDSEYPQVVSENILNIPGTKTLFQVIKTEPNIVLNLFYQAVNAIYTAFQLFGLSHNNITLNNLLVRPTHNNLNWLVPLNRDVDLFRYLLTNRILVFTNFTTSSFVYQGQFYFVPQTNSPDTKVPDSKGFSRPTNDIIKLIVAIYAIVDQQLKSGIQTNIDTYKIIADAMKMSFTFFSIGANGLGFQITNDIDIFIKLNASDNFNLDFRQNFEKVETNGFLEDFLAKGIRPLLAHHLDKQLIELDPASGKRIVDLPNLFDVIDNWNRFVSLPPPSSTSVVNIGFSGGGGGGGRSRGRNSRSSSRTTNRSPPRRSSRPQRSRSRSRSRSRPQRTRRSQRIRRS
jgi:hypothetical protein